MMMEFLVCHILICILSFFGHLVLYFWSRFEFGYYKFSAFFFFKTMKSFKALNLIKYSLIKNIYNVKL